MIVIIRSEIAIWFFVGESNVMDVQRGMNAEEVTRLLLAEDALVTRRLNFL